jgi:hypothetical protein
MELLRGYVFIDGIGHHCCFDGSSNNFCQGNNQVWPTSLIMSTLRLSGVLAVAFPNHVAWGGGGFF